MRFEYAWSTDAVVVARQGRPMQHRPIVARIVQSAGFGQPDLRTGFAYAGPVLGTASPIDPRPPGFLGVEQVTIDRSGQQGDSSTRVVKTFDYTPRLADHGGRLASELTSIQRAGALAPVTHTQYVYGANPAGTTAASFTYLANTIERVCAPGATAAACAAQPPTRTTAETWSSGWAGTVPQLWLHTRTEPAHPDEGDDRAGEPAAVAAARDRTRRGPVHRRALPLTGPARRCAAVERRGPAPASLSRLEVRARRHLDRVPEGVYSATTSPCMPCRTRRSRPFPRRASRPNSWR